MKEWFSAKELAGLPGMPTTVQGIIKRSLSDNWSARPRQGRGGGREYHITCLPEQTRLHLFHAEMPIEALSPARILPISDPLTRTAPATTTPLLVSPSTPANSSAPVSPARRATSRSAMAALAPESRTSVAQAPGPGTPAPLFPTPRTPDGPAPALPNTLPDALPEKARRIALARLDLLRLWQEYRNCHPKATLADPEFASAYNSGALFANLFAILGKTSVQTLYRWKAALNGAQDWTLLVPTYYVNRAAGFPSLSPEEATTFLGLLLKPSRLHIGTATKLTRAYLSTRGITSDKSDMTYRRFAERFRSQFYDRWVLLREGQKALRDKVEPFIKRDPSLLQVGDVLVADGHRLNFQIINPFTGKPCRATLVGYVDWKSYDLAGYEIMIEENTQCIASALRSSILRLGKYPHIAYQDNGRAFRSRFFTSTESFEETGIYGLFGRLGIVPVFAHPYNARAKIIEGWFKWFSDSFERLLPSYTGASIEDKPAWMLRNEKFHKALHNQYVPTIAETVEYLDSWLHFHRAQPCPHVKGATIGEVFDQGRGPGVDPAVLDDLMMAARIAQIGRNGIRFLNADYYDDNLYGLRQQVVIRYSIFDLSSVKVHTSKGEPLCIARRVESVHPMAAHLGNVKDVESLKRTLAHHASLEKRTIKNVRDLARAGKTVQLDWQKVIDVSPRIIEKLEREHVPSLPCLEQHIPDEALSEGVESLSIDTSDNGDVSSRPVPERAKDLIPSLSDLTPGSRPFFSGPSMDVDRYEWHLSHGFHSTEDMEFKLWFESTDTYRLLYVVLPAEQRQAAEEAQRLQTTKNPASAAI